MHTIAMGVFENGSPVPPVTRAYNVTMRQAKLALFNAGKLEIVEAAIAALPEPGRTVAQIEWDSGSVVERMSPTVALIASAAGLSESDLDRLFDAASAL